MRDEPLIDVIEGSGCYLFCKKGSAKKLDKGSLRVFLVLFNTKNGFFRLFAVIYMDKLDSVEVSGGRPRVILRTVR